MGKKKKRSVWSRLFDSTDNKIAASTVYLFATLTISLILLFIPAIAILVDVIYNHTVTLDLSGMASYIGAASAIGGSGGVLKAITNWATYKYIGKPQPQIDENDTDSSGD